MGFPIEFNWVLALRKYNEKGRTAEECLPQKIEEGEQYHFMKQEYRIYPLNKEIDLVTTRGEGKLSKPLAKVRITQLILGFKNTQGYYEIIKKLK